MKILPRTGVYTLQEAEIDVDYTYTVVIDSNYGADRDGNRGVTDYEITDLFINFPEEASELDRDYIKLSIYNQITEKENGAFDIYMDWEY